MTLHKRVEKLDRNFIALQGQEAERVLIQALRTRVRRIVTDSQKIKRVIANEERLKKQVGTKVDLPKPSEALASKPKALKKRLERESLYEVVRDQEWANAFLNPLETYLERLDAKMLGAWQEAIDAKVPETESLFLQLERLGYSTQVLEGRSAIEAIQRLRACLPTSDTAMADVDAKLAVVRHAISTLKSVPPALTGFLAKLASKSATLVSYAELDKASIEWLKEHDLLQRIRLTLT